MDKPKVYFRADGHAQMGLGHVIRSLALADMLKEAFACHFIIRSPLPTLKQQILETCATIIELPETADDLQEAQSLTEQYLTGDEIVVLDGYHFVTAYQRIIKDKGCKLVCIDDIHAYHFVADVVINHAGGIRPDHYSAEPYTQFCLGLKYALLRKPFREAAKNRQYPDRKNNYVFVCLGGADPNNDTVSVLQQCASIQGIEKVFLVIGSAYLHKTVLLAFLEEIKLEVEILENLSAEEMVQYMKRCGIAITPPSTIAFEYLSVGGILFLKIIADNQLDINDYFLKHQLAFPLEKLTTAIEFDRKKTFSLQEKLFDGLAKSRFLKIFQNLISKTKLPSICLLVSGGLGYQILENLHFAAHPISAVFTNKTSEPIIAFCQQNRIPIFVGNPRKGRARAFIQKIYSDLLLSVNYLYLIEEDLIQHPRQYAINIHGSLLPKYRGRTPHVWAIINGEKQAGITAHLIDHSVDNGDIIKQVRVKIGEKDTGADVLNKYHKLYPKVIFELIAEVARGNLQTTPQDTSLATYFGKRTPEDGHINWEWSKERIRNWIRAQARPYPGAFSFYDDNKITINKALFSDLGFHFEEENGKILKVTEDGIYVKTTNGCLLLTGLETEKHITFKQGSILK